MVRADLTGAQPCQGDTHPTTHQGSQHGEEAPGGTGDGARVGAIGGDLGKAVQQILPGNPHLVEPDTPVVDTVETELLATVLDANTRADAAVVLADRHQESMDPVARVVDDELGKDGGQTTVERGVADVVLAGTIVRCVDDELLGSGIVAGHGLELRDVRAVPGLGHRKAAGQLQASNLRQIALELVLRIAELQDRAAKKTELDSKLDEHTEVVESEGLEDGHKGAEIPGAAIRRRKAQRAEPFGGQQTTSSEDLFSVGRSVQIVLVAEIGSTQDLLDSPSELVMTPFEETGHGADVEARLGLDGGAGSGRSGTRRPRVTPGPIRPRACSISTRASRSAADGWCPPPVANASPSSLRDRF